MQHVVAKLSLSVATISVKTGTRSSLISQHTKMLLLIKTHPTTNNTIVQTNLVYLRFYSETS
jgi:hypothetical protein